MNRIAWTLIGLVARLLEQDDRDAVLGDLLESREGAVRGFLDVLGVVSRRQALLWKSPRPWLAGFVVALPCSYLLMHVSISVSCTYQRLVNHKIYPCWHTGHEGFPLLACHIVLLIAWSWAGGYIVGSVSRGTVWLSAALSVFPAVFSLWVCGTIFPARFCLFLFLVPAVFGAHRGLRDGGISFRAASLLALTMTLLMVSAWSSQALWVLNWALILPALYLVALAWRSEDRTGFRPVGHASVS
jgi:hypothetical protein